MLTCPLCRLNFNSSDRKAMIGLCGHTVCRSCRSSLFSWRCPVSQRCRRAGDIFVVPQEYYDVTNIVNCFTSRQEIHDQMQQEFNGVHEEKKAATKLVEEEKQKFEKLKGEIEDLKERSKKAQKETSKCLSCQTIVEIRTLMFCNYCSKGDKEKNICPTCFLDDHSSHPSEAFTDDKEGEVSVMVVEEEEVLILEDSIVEVEVKNDSIVFLEPVPRENNDSIVIVDCVSAENVKIEKERKKKEEDEERARKIAEEKRKSEEKKKNLKRNSDEMFSPLRRSTRTRKARNFA